MNACHILLGHPWQFDRKIKHDGFTNTYSFCKDSLNITLALLDTRRKNDGEPNLFLSRSLFTKEIKNTPLLFAIVVAECNEEGNDIPIAVQPILSDFSGVLPDEFLTGLPLMRDIQHCIDFVPSLSIPNKPTYRLNPNEFEELQRQVSELLAKGLIRESMSAMRYPHYSYRNREDLFKCALTVGR
ncbi:uncharacterized protein [Rutidosis leptorrhynchoides]|uniref:uncharacterized protein n=1 Tax=Rutidosis leptorrhynchoides TaxID=125765 RepID=UPI003A99D21E